MEESTTAASIPAEAKSPVRQHYATKRQIRGSSLLLVGQLLAKGVNFGVQVFIVRYLTRSDYGAFAYAMSFVGLGESITTFGLDRAITRFVPIYHEQKDYQKMFGTILMVIGSVLGLSLALTLFIYSFPGLVAKQLGADDLSFRLLLILVFLAPIQTIDGLLVGMFAVFASARSIFFRKYVLGPALKLSVVILLVTLHSNVSFLAWGYVVSAALGILIYSIILIKVMKDLDLFPHFRFKTAQVPWREVLSFTVPLLTSDLLYAVMNTMDAVVLERYWGNVDVAALRAVQPTAVLNSLVMSSFAILFTPMAARMFAHKDREGINNLYWQTAIWIAVFTFPIFALTFSMAKPVTIFLYGDRYAKSATILALLSLGYYFDAALGFNGLTIKVYGKVAYSVIINVLAGVFNFLAIIILIPKYGALGGAIGTFGALVFHNILKQAGLRLGTGISLFDWRYFRVYLVIIGSALGLWLFQAATNSSVITSIAAAGAASLLVLLGNRNLLNLHQTFPELLRIPIFRFLFGEKRESSG
jgi:O-antigen/teichoic acid export membrane protein